MEIFWKINCRGMLLNMTSKGSIQQPDALTDPQLGDPSGAIPIFCISALVETDILVCRHSVTMVDPFRRRNSHDALTPLLILFNCLSPYRLVEVALGEGGGHRNTSQRMYGGSEITAITMLHSRPASSGSHHCKVHGLQEIANRSPSSRGFINDDRYQDSDNTPVFNPRDLCTRHMPKQ